MNNFKRLNTLLEAKKDYDKEAKNMIANRGYHIYDFLGALDLKKQADRKLHQAIRKQLQKKESFKITEARKSKKDYVIYHKTYTSSVNEMLDFIERNGYQTTDDDVFHEISIGGKPSKDQTKRISLALTKNGKLQKKALQAQVYNMGNKFELNMYIL